MKKTAYRFRLTALAVLAVLAMVFAACENPSGDVGDGYPALIGPVSARSEDGTPQVGLAITADTGGLYGTGAFTYQWQRGGTAGGNFTNIDGATEASYTPVAGDVGKYIRVVVGLAGYSGTQTSAAAGPVLRAGVTNLTATPGDGQVTLKWTNLADADLDHIEITWTWTDWAITLPVTKGTQTKTISSLIGGTDYTFTVKAVDGATPPNKSGEASVRVIIPLSSVDAVTAYLSGGTIGAPIPLPVILDLSEDWTALLSAIQSGDKYVALDLSACTSDTEFDPVNDTTVDKVVSLVLPDAATSIKSNGGPAFRDFTNLTRVSGNNIVTVDYSAFHDCAQLATVNLPVATTIGDSAFSGCIRLATVNLPAAETIGDYTFSGCIQLATVNLPVAETIGDYAFAGCTQLATVSFPTATTIGGSAFLGCTQLATVNFPAATTIGEEAFRHCTQLATVSLPAAETIGAGAFDYCTQLATVSLPTTLIEIGVNPFVGCTNLTTIEVAADNPNYKSENGMLLNKTGTTLIACPSAASTVTLDTELNTVTTIGWRAFFGCTQLATVNLPAAETIGAGAFDSTGGKTLTVTLGSTVPTLGAGIFNDVSAKTVTVKVPSGAEAWNGIPGTYNETSSYTANWGNGFRGGGWTESAFAENSEININNKIALTVKTY
ncbi:MAG: leucine-rich repeat protein [Spirochaetaceae bacterium]|jgi:hypothetical protein|nr:leucine-rich repeat protein [Spirochaetaceae bacterium]